MKAYWIALYTEIQNTNNLKKYAEIVTPIIKSYGGIPLIRGGEYKVLSGDDFPRTVVWEFPNFDKANKCYYSKEYQNGWLIAKDTSERHMQIVEGFNIE